MAVGADAVLTAEWLDRGPARVGGGVLIALGTALAVGMWAVAIALDTATDGTHPAHALDDAFAVLLFAAGSVVELGSLIGGIYLLGLEDRAHVVRRPWRGGSAVTVAPWLAPASGGGLRVMARF